MCVVLKMHLMYVFDEKVEEHIARVQANCNMFAWAPVDLEEPQWTWKKSRCFIIRWKEP